MLRIAVLAALAVSVFGSQSNNKVIGGTDAPAVTYTWQVSLQEPYNGGYWHFCGGSLISANYVMSAAHCYKSPDLVTVYLGSTQKFTGGIRSNVESFLEHPDYDSSAISNDYAIIKLSKAVDTDSASVGIIALPKTQDPEATYSGQGIVTGWGYSVYYGQNRPQNELPTDLQVGELPILTDEECSSLWGDYYLSDVMVCAGANSETGSCMGDSGGPFVTDINGEQTLIGAVSWGSSSCSLEYPSVFAKIASVANWIRENSDAA